MSRPRIEKYQVKYSKAGNGPCHWYIILRRPGGRKVRSWFPTKEKAEYQCIKRNAELGANGSVAMTLSAALADTARRGEGRLQAYSWTLQRAVDFTVEHLEKIHRSVPVSAIFDHAREVCEKRIAKGQNRESHYANVKNSFGKFLPKFGARLVATITQEEVRTWAEKLPLTIHSQNRHLKIICAAFERAKLDKIIPENPLAGTELQDEPRTDIQIMSIDQTSGFFQNLAPEWVPFFSLVAFAGVRREEATKLAQ